MFDKTKTNWTLPDALEALDEQEEGLIKEINDLRMRILAKKRELSSSTAKISSSKGLGERCYFCDEFLDPEALLCQFCKRPSISNMRKFAILEKFIQTKIGSFKGK